MEGMIVMKNIKEIGITWGIIKKNRWQENIMIGYQKDGELDLRKIGDLKEIIKNTIYQKYFSQNLHGMAEIFELS